MKHRGDILSSKVKWVIALRTVIITFILAFTALMQMKGMDYLNTPQLGGLYSLAGVSFLLTLIYSAFFRKLSTTPLFGYLQFMIDNLLVSMIVTITGGVDSLFSVLYFLIIIGGSILFYRKGGLIITLQSTALYSAAIFIPFLSRYSEWLDMEGRYLFLPYPYVIYRAIVNILAFFIICALGSYLSESLRRADEALIARESDLAELQSLYENIVQNISSGLVTMDMEGKIISFNRAAEKITRQNADECRKKTIFDIFSFPDGYDIFSPARSSHNTGWRCEGKLVGKSSIILGITFSPLRDETGKISGLICSFQDLTEIRKLEEQIKRSDRLAAIGQMAAGVAHEIRNPLASISGSIQVLREDLPVNESTRSLMDIVTRETDRLNSIINDFLLFANPRPLQCEETDLGNILNESITLLKKSLPRGNSYRFVVTDNSDGTRVDADPQMMKQVFWNLSLNAVQAMPEGGTLEVRIMPVTNKPGSLEQREGKWMVIEFIDTGEGFAPEEMSSVFTPFFSTKENGTGLGLSIVFKIVETHRGSIEIESQKGKGSLFRIKLPMHGEAE